MPEPLLIAHRMTRNATAGLRAVECEPRLAPSLVAQYGEEPLREGLRGLRELLGRLYADMGECPEAYGVPPVPDSKIHDARSRRKVVVALEEPLKLLYTLGSAGQVQSTEAGHRLLAPGGELEDAARELRLQDVSAAAASLARVGLRLEAVQEPGERDGLLEVRADGCPNLGLALKVFCETCRLWERGKLKLRQMPQVFLLADYRILSRTDTRARLPKLTIDDVLPYVPEEKLADLRLLIEHLESLGYRADVEHNGVLDGGWNVNFVGARHGKTLFGFFACRGRLGVRVSFRDIGRMLPSIYECPPRLQRQVLSGRCGRCGGSGCGKQISVTVDGEQWDICYFGLAYLDPWGPSDIAPLKTLLGVQDRFYQEAAA